MDGAKVLARPQMPTYAAYQAGCDGERQVASLESDLGVHPQEPSGWVPAAAAHGLKRG